MIDARLLLKFINKTSVSKILYSFLLIAILPTLDFWLYIFISTLIPGYHNLFLASTFGFSLFCFFISFAIVRSELTEIKFLIKNGVYPKKQFQRLAGSFITTWLLVTPGIITSVVGLIFLIPGLKTLLGKLITHSFQKDMKSVYEYIKLYEIEI